jgi:prevent-host-death family protein
MNDCEADMQNLTIVTGPKERPHGDWKLEDAKARFSELVRRARAEGPQSVTVRGQRSVVIIDAGQYDRLAAPKPKLPFVDFLETLSIGELDLTRDKDTGREVEF